MLCSFVDPLTVGVPADAELKASGADVLARNGTRAPSGARRFALATA